MPYVAPHPTPMVSQPLPPRTAPPRVTPDLYYPDYLPGSFEDRRPTANPDLRGGRSLVELVPFSRITPATRPINGPAPTLAMGVLPGRRPPPTVPQFDGTVLVGNPPVPAARTVELRWRDGTVVDITKSDPVTGYFSFKGWYSTFTDYEFLVRGDGFISRAYPTRPPRTLQWNGNPKIVDSYVPE